MTEERIRRILEEHKAGGLSSDEAMERLRTLPFEDLGFANVDHHRSLRQGIPEVVFAPGKTRAQILEIADRLAAGGHDVMVTRIDPDDAEALTKRLPGTRYSEQGRIAWRKGKRKPAGLGRVGRNERAHRMWSGAGAR